LTLRLDSPRQDSSLVPIDLTDEVPSRTRLSGDPPRGALIAELRAMLALALPVVVSELGWMAMGVVDTMMVGRLGPAAIGGVGIGNVVFWGVAIFGFGLLMGMDTLVSQSFGAGDRADCHRSLVQGVLLALAVSGPMMLLISATVPILRVSGIDPRVVALAVPYLEVMNWGLPPLLVFSAFRRYLQGMNRPMPVLVALVVANITNFLGNWVFIEGRLGLPALGVAGSGWATVCSRLAMLGMLAAYTLIYAKKHATGLLTTSLRPDLARQRALLRLGIPAAIHMMLEMTVFGAAALLAGRLGEEAIAAHEVVITIASTAFMVPFGISTAGAVRVGQAIGRRDPDGARRSGWTAMALGAGFMAASGLTMLSVPGTILGRFTSDPGVLATSRSLLVAAAVFQVFDGLQVVSAGVLRGAGETRMPMVVNLVAHWAIGLPIGYAIAFPLRGGVLGLWIGLAAGLIAAGSSLLIVWARRSLRDDGESP
jgi:MATE family multidrug resistance protein